MLGGQSDLHCVLEDQGPASDLIPVQGHDLQETQVAHAEADKSTATVASEGEGPEKQLPDDVLLDILVRVRKDCRKEFFHCMRVSKQWKRVAPSAVSALTWTCGVKPSQAARLTSRFENLRTVTMDRCSVFHLNWVPVFGDLGLHCPHLESLSMLYVHPLLDTAAVNSLFSHCKALTAVEFYKSLTFDVTLPVECMASLHHLYIDSFESTTTNFDPEHIHIPTLSSLSKLTILTLRNLSQYELPPLSQLTNLRSLSVFCYNLSFEELPLLTDLALLEILDLSWCVSLRTVPPLDHLPHLHTLRLNGLDSLERIPGIERLTQLRALDLSCCDSLVNLQPLTMLRRLETLGLDVDPVSAEWIFEWLVDLTALKQLVLYVNGVLTIPLLRLPRNLQSLEIWKVRQQIMTFHVEGPECLESLTTFSGIDYMDQVLCSLKTLKVKAIGRNRRRVPPFDCLTNLRELDFLTDGLTSDPNEPDSDMSLFPWGDGIETCPPFHTLTNLQYLCIQMPLFKCWPISPFATLGQLRQLSLTHCSSLTEIPSFEGLSTLRVLKIQNCLSLRALPSLDFLPSLKEVRFESLPALTRLPALGSLVQLRTFLLVRCSNVVEVPPFIGLAALEEIWLGHCTSLKNLPELSGLGKLLVLNLNGCRGLEWLPALDGLPRLQWVNLEGCTGLQTRVHASGQLYGGGVCQEKDLEVVQIDKSAPESRFFMFHDPYVKEYSRWRSSRLGGQSQS